MLKSLLCGTVAVVAIGGVGVPTASAEHDAAFYGGGGHHHHHHDDCLPRYPRYPRNPRYPVYPVYPQYYAPQPVVVPVYPQPYPYPIYNPGIGFSNKNFSLWLGR